MIRTRLRGRGKCTPTVSSEDAEVFNFTSSLPSPFTYARADTASTYRDSSGELRIVTANQPRFDHTIDGVPLGLLIEGARTNKCTNINNAPDAGFTGLTRAGDAASVMSRVADATPLATAKLGNVVTANVIDLDNTLGVASAHITIGGTTANTNAHSLSVYARVVSGASATMGLVSGAGNVTFTNTGYERIVSPNVTPASSAEQMRITVPAGARVRFILNQLEERIFVSTVMAGTGPIATNRDDVIVTTLATEPWFSKDLGYITARYKVMGFVGSLSTSLQTVFCPNNNNTTDSYSVRSTGDDKDISSRFSAGGLLGSPASSNVPHYANQQATVGFSWSTSLRYQLDGETGLSETTTRTMPATLTRLNLGARNGGNEALFGWVQSLKVGLTQKTGVDLHDKMLNSTDIVSVGGGQSLMRGHWVSQDSGSAGGRNKMIETLSSYEKFKAMVFIDGSTGGTFAAASSGSPYWWDNATGLKGTAFDTFYTQAAFSPIAPKYILWSQGEADSGQIPSTTSRAEYKAALLAIFNDMHTTWPSAKIMIQRIGLRTGAYSNPDGVQVVREVQAEVISELDYVYQSHETYDLTLSTDGVHLADASYVTSGLRMARKLSSMEGYSVTGVNGPSVGTPTRSGTTVTVPIVHDGGTDFTPTTGIEGFSYRDGGGTPVTISAAVRTNATTITLTLASGVAGTLYYIYGPELTINRANVVKDNATISMPLQSGKWTVA